MNKSGQNSDTMRTIRKRVLAIRRRAQPTDEQKRALVLRLRAPRVPELKRRLALRRRTALIAEMGQGDPKSRAVHILARRAREAGVLKVQDIGGKLVGTEFDQSYPRTSFRWAKNEPDLPERMVRTGQMTREDYPEFVRNFLRPE